MKIVRKLFLAFIVLGMLAALSFRPASTQVAQAAGPGTIVYNLFATDGYYELPDGTPLYMYGFIGGRETVPATPLVYQTSFVFGSPPTVQTIATGAPTPTGGPVTAAEAALQGNAQYPAPIIYAGVGDIVEIRLKNLGVAANPLAPNDPHSIHLHGLDVDAANDGVPETSVGAVPANLCVDGSTAADCSAAGGSAPGAGNVIVYMFAPTKLGTYMYHCHQEADIHVQMGMYGALVIYNKTDAAYLFGGPGKGFGGNLWGFQYTKDYIMLLSEFDVRGHQSEEGTYAPQPWDPNPFNWAQYKPQYWSINGLSFPQTIHASFPSTFLFSDWLLAHPGYDPLITGSVSAPQPNLGWGPGDKVLIRVINMGFETQPMHMHGYHGKILGSDQRVWDWANKPGNNNVKNPKPPTLFGAGLEKNTLLIGSGETYEWMVDMGQQSFQSFYPANPLDVATPPLQAWFSSFLGGTQSRYDLLNLPMSNILTGNLAIPEAGSAAPAAPTYIGGPAVTGAVGVPAATQFFPFHNHDDYKATNNGTYPGGMFTMIVPTP